MMRRQQYNSGINEVHTQTVQREHSPLSRARTTVAYKACIEWMYHDDRWPGTHHEPETGMAALDADTRLKSRLQITVLEPIDRVC